MKRTNTWLCALAIFSAAPSLAWASGNLLSNGGFELGSLSGWSVDGSPLVVSSEASSGLYPVQLGASDAVVYEWSTALLVASITELSFDIKHLGGPLSQVFFTYSDGSTSASVVDGLFESDDWLHYDLTGELAAGKSLSSLAIYGTSGDPTFVDQVSVITNTSAVPEPGAAYLMGAGLLFMGLLRSRTRAK